MLTVHEKSSGAEEGMVSSTLEEIAREGARRMLVAALEAEVAAYLEEHAWSGMSRVIVWWCARARHAVGRCFWERELWRFSPSGQRPSSR